jgi:hypothetical protein
MEAVWAGERSDLLPRIDFANNSRFESVNTFNTYSIVTPNPRIASILTRQLFSVRLWRRP